jgi:hypothetical protein
MLSDPDAMARVEAGQVQFTLVGRDLARLDRRLEAEIDPTGIRLRF